MAGLKALNINTPPEAEPHIYAEDDAAIYKAIFGGDGVSTIGQACKATVLSNNKVRIADGVLCVDGHMARIPYGEYEDCEIMNGQSGKNRNDIIVAKFETTGTGGIDTMTCEAIQGIAGEMAVDPELTQDDIYAGGKVREYPLYRVKIEGLSITAVEQMFEIIPSNKDLTEKLGFQMLLNTDEQQIYTMYGGRVKVVSGTKVIDVSRNIGYVRAFSGEELKALFGESFNATRLTVTTCNGDDVAQETHFYEPEIWKGEIFQYFYPTSVEGKMRINYKMEYVYGDNS
nr:MAG TPA_asm: Receptor Binding Protein sandwich domain, phage receptor [Caudoviricetes sp.]